MLYDRHAPYAYQADMSFSREPLKAIYVCQRLITTLLLVPLWTIFYSIAPRSYRPRPSWSLRQIIFVLFTRRIYRVTEVAGVTSGTRDPEHEPRTGSLGETRFEWVRPLEERLRTGVVALACEPSVPFRRVGVFVWPKLPPLFEPYQDRGKIFLANNFYFLNLFSAERCSKIIGMYFHGGGYCHMSAHESSGTSRIPRRLIKVSNCFPTPDPPLC